MLKIHGIARSRAFRCIWAAEEAGLAYEVVPLGFVPGFKLERPLAINPNNKIPALEDGDLVLFESLAINLHIAGKVGAPLMPSGNDASRVLQWTLWAATEAEPHVMRWAYNAFLRPPADRGLQYWNRNSLHGIIWWAMASPSRILTLLLCSMAPS
jgi:glutathione S-transferase